MSVSIPDRMPDLPGRRSELAREDLSVGQVKVTPHGEGWYLIEIGRGRYVKRFNLRDTEYRQLVEMFPGPA